jgi:protoporphyrinogen oxidase
MNKNIVVVGGGLPGMITAYLVKKKFYNFKVYLIEKTNHLGGLYSSIDFEQRYTFDIGMHLIYSCKNEYLNNFLKKTLYNKWNIFENVKKDIAGVFFNNNLNQKSPYLDLTNLSSNRLEKYKNKIYSLSKTKIKKLNKYKNLAEYFKSRFGNEIYTEVIGPIILKLWGIKGEMMHPLASKIVLMDRLILYKDSLNLSRILTNNNLRSRIGFPNQFSLPKKYYSNQKFALYPKEFGLKNVINFFEKKLIKLDIKIFKNTDIETAKISKNIIQTLVVKKKKSII